MRGRGGCLDESFVLVTIPILAEAPRATRYETQLGPDGGLHAVSGLASAHRRKRQVAPKSINALTCAVALPPDCCMIAKIDL